MKKFLLSSICCALLLVGCGSSSGSDTNTTSNSTTQENTTVEKTGTVADGYISGATVCIDTNGNYICDEGEKTYTTDNNGQYNFDASEINYTHIATGGTDVATNEDNNETLIKPEGETNATITPITTLVAYYMKETNATLTDAKTTIAKVLDINESDITADPVQHPEVEKSVQKVVTITKLKHTDLKTLSSEINGSETNLTDLADNNTTIIDALNYIDELNASAFDDVNDLEQNISNHINSVINTNTNEESQESQENTSSSENNATQKVITTSQTGYSDFNVSLKPGSYYIVFENNNINQPAQIDINTSDILVNNEEINNSDDANISSVKNNDVFDDIVLNVENESNISIPFKTVDNSGVISTNVWAAVVDANYTNDYNHSIEINQTVTNKFLLPNEADQYYNFSTSEQGDYDVNVSGVEPNKLINYTVTLTDSTGKKIIDDEKVDSGVFNTTVSLDANTSYTIKISITDGKLDSVRNDYVGYYQLKITK